MANSPSSSDSSNRFKDIYKKAKTYATLKVNSKSCSSKHARKLSIYVHRNNVDLNKYNK